VLRRAAAPFLALSVGAGAAFAQVVPQCSGDLKPGLVAQLLFGRTGVSDAGWARFLAKEITLRFPDGLTVYDGRGQWRPPGSQTVIRERSRVVTIAMQPSAENDTRLQEVVEAYKKRFHQTSVGLIEQPACVSF
jgi:uncharacterized protein DUF3574